MMTFTRFALLVGVMSVGLAATAQQLPSEDAAPRSAPIASAQGQQGTYNLLGDRIFGPIDCGTAAGNAGHDAIGLLGTEYAWGYYWVTGRNAATNHHIYQYAEDPNNPNATLLNTYVIQSGAGSAWGHRDIATNEHDGGFKLWSGHESGLLAEYDFDPNSGPNGTLSPVTTYTISPGPTTVRALAHIQDGDPTNGTPDRFYTVSFGGTVYEFTINPNQVVNSYPNPGKAFYGMAYDDDTTTLWGFSQDNQTGGFPCPSGGTGDLNEFNEYDLAFIPTGRQFQGVAQMIDCSNIAGGLDIYTDATCGDKYLFAFHQSTPDQINIYELDGTTVVDVYCTAKTGLVCGIPTITSCGDSSVSNGVSNPLTLSASPARQNRSGLFLYSCSGRAAIPFQGGFLCVNPAPLRRSTVVNSGGASACAGVFTIDWNAFTVGALGGNPDPCIQAAAQQTNVQTWGRDSVATGSFLSDAAEFTTEP